VRPTTTTASPPTLDAVLNGAADGLGGSTLRTIHRVSDPNDRAR
jgi:hypothetical protein